ncbi:AraC family transcriptional regulator [Mucilaginibacter limnophilus]|uniref:AraC family transcriptional regulator n=2 Tax=Mucilaginibacter limnophilus TaxID=1932778 RepID=A0A437MFM6_9SPHI|nr:AraC family transcriptional regulator [Mucilaginibacter limnophilus]
MQAITDYKDSTDLSTSGFVYFQILSVFGLIQQSLRTFSGIYVISGLDKQQLLNYIHQNIYDPQKCRIDVIASCFNISPTYFGAYFKRNFGVSYRNYFHQYRWSLIEKRLKSGKLNNKQIAVEFCFSDESHFSNYCQKIKKQRALDQ